MKAKIHWQELALIVLGLAWCGTLLVGRHLLFGARDFGFMAWNLMLATVPLGFSFWLPWIRSRVAGFTLIAAWLLFFPNAPYVLTDLIHLRTQSGEHWHSVLLLLSFALVGLMLGFASLWRVHEWVAAQTNRWLGWLFVVVCLFLTGFGIYLGRFLRWNSWSILTHPMGVMGDVARRFLWPHHHLQTWGVTMGFGVLLLILYAHYRTTTPAAAAD